LKKLNVKKKRNELNLYLAVGQKEGKKKDDEEEEIR